MHPAISVVVPVYKEESNVVPFLQRLESSINSLALTYEVIFCLDPSPDQTEAVILNEISRNPAIKLLVFSRRFGQPAATMAGVFASTGDACIVIDVDLQDPPELIKSMYEKLQEGYEVVLAKRRSRSGETMVKRLISYVGYAIINKLSDVPIPRDTGDFRIMTRRVIEELRNLNETHGFLRGLVSFVGFKHAFVEYDRDERLSGKGNYNRLTGSFKIGLNGLISFSSRPLQLMSMGGFIMSFLSFVLGAWYLLHKILGANYPQGFSSTVLLLTFLSGLQLLALGLVGEYIGRIYDEVKKRPMYILDRKVNFNNELNDTKNKNNT